MVKGANFDFFTIIDNEEKICSDLKPIVNDSYCLMLLRRGDVLVLHDVAHHGTWNLTDHEWYGVNAFIEFLDEYIKNRI